MKCIIVLDLDTLAPRIPESVQIRYITPISATVQFTLTDPFDATRPEGFVVMYGLISGQLNSNSSVITATSSSQTYSITLTSLQIGTQYFYRVVTTNQFATQITDEMSLLTNDTRKLIVMYGFYSQLSVIFLLGPGPVSALEVNSVNDTTLLISWGEPVSPNGNILSYSITITDLRDDSAVRSEDKATEESTIFVVTRLGW